MKKTAQKAFVKLFLIIYAYSTLFNNVKTKCLINMDVIALNICITAHT